MKDFIRRLTITAVLAASAACATHSAPDRTACPGKSAESFYFAIGMFNANDTFLDELFRQAYSKQLNAMGEPSLSCGDHGEAYRFTWLRSFHHPVAVRITRSNENIVLHAVELDGQGGYDPGRTLRSLTKSITSEEFRSIETLFSKKAFDDLPSTEAHDGADGSNWIVEASNHGKYHMVVRWSPKDGPVHEIGNQFLMLTGWKFTDMY